jgi:hypothetical protein
MAAFVKHFATIDTEFGLANLVATRRQDGNLEVHLEDSDGLVLGVVSWNPHHCNTQPDEFLMKEFGSGEQFFYELLATGLFIDTGRRVYRGLISAPVWALKHDDHVPRTRNRQVCSLLRP